MTEDESWENYYHLCCRHCNEDVLVGKLKYKFKPTYEIDNTLQLIKKIDFTQNVNDIKQYLPEFLNNYDKKLSLSILINLINKLVSSVDITNYIISFIGIHNINNILHHKIFNKKFNPIDQNIFYVKHTGIIYCDENMDKYLDEIFLCYDCINNYKLFLK